MKSVSDVRFEAMKRFNPKALCDFLIKLPNGVVCVDKTRCATADDDQLLFSVVMHCDYRWDYGDFDACTVFLEEEEEGRIYGGIYDLSRDKKLTHRLISVVKSDCVTDLYAYDADVFGRMCCQIRNAK